MNLSDQKSKSKILLLKTSFSYAKSVFIRFKISQIWLLNTKIRENVTFLANFRVWVVKTIKNTLIDVAANFLALLLWNFYFTQFSKSGLLVPLINSNELKVWSGGDTSSPSSPPNVREWQYMFNKSIL